MLRKPGGERYVDQFESYLKEIPSLLTGGKSHDVLVLDNSDSLSTTHTDDTVMAVDIETTGLYPRRDNWLRTGYYTGKSKAVSYRVKGLKDLFYTGTLLNSPAKKVVHNLGMEEAWSQTYFGHGLRNVVGDTMLMAIRDDEDQPVSLEVLAARAFPDKFGGYKMDTKDALEAGQAAWLDPVVLGTRNALDCEATWLLYQQLAANLGPEQMDLHRRYDLPIAASVARMAGRGLALDRSALLDVRRACLDRMEKAVGMARKMAGDPELNLRSHPQVRKAMQRLGIKTLDTTEGGEMSTDKLSLLGTRGTQDPLSEAFYFTEALLDFREADKVHSTYAVGLGKQEEAGMVYSDWRWPGTSTKRLSSSNPNLQNIPIRKALGQRVRTAFRSRWPDGRLVEVDESQIEPRILASLSGDPAMRAIFNEGRDLYMGVTKKVFGTEEKEKRFCTKVVYLGWMYGAGAPTTQSSVLSATGILLPIDTVENLLNGFNEEFGLAREYLDDLRERALKSEVIYAPIGGFRTDPGKKMLTAGSYYKRMEIARSAANFPIQCAGSILTLMALTKIPESEDFLPCAAVHDSILVDCRNETVARQVAKDVERYMVETCREQPWFTVPAAAEGKMGPNWGAMTRV